MSGLSSGVGVVNVKDYFGASGLVNNAKALTVAVNYAKANDLTLYLPEGTYYFPTDITIEGVRCIVFVGTVKLATGKTLEVTYDSNLAPCDWKFTNITGGKLRLSGLNSSKIEVLRAKHLELYAHGDNPKKEFIAYNSFLLGKVDTFTMFSEGTKWGWINENKFYGGRMTDITIDGNFSHDNNIFYGTMLEGFNLNMINGNSNYFYDVRFEDENNVRFGKGTFNNVMYRSWSDNKDSYLRGVADTAFTDDGNNQIINNLDLTHKRETIFEINSRTSNYPLSVLTRNKDDLTIADSNKVIFESDLIELINPIGIVLDSDKDLFFIQVFAYDENKQLIKTKQDNFIAMAGGGSFYASGGSYTFDSNVGASATGVPLYPDGIIKYFKYKLLTGTSSVVGQSFQSVRLDTIATVLNKNRMKTLSNISQWTHTVVPTKGTWERGDIVYNSSPTAGGYTGWICVSAGTPGKWKGFGLIEA